jgi:hypothetical protein
MMMMNPVCLLAVQFEQRKVRRQDRLRFVRVDNCLLVQD